LPPGGQAGDGRRNLGQHIGQPIAKWGMVYKRRPGALGKGKKRENLAKVPRELVREEIFYKTACRAVF